MNAQMETFDAAIHKDMNRIPHSFTRDSPDDQNFRYLCSWKPFSISCCSHSDQYHSIINDTKREHRESQSTSENMDIETLTIDPEKTIKSQLLAIGSFILKKNNFVDLVYVDGSHFAKIEDSSHNRHDHSKQKRSRLLYTAQHDYLPCKLKWSHSHSPKPLLASCSAQVHIWDLKTQDNNMRLEQLLTMGHKKSTESVSAPITSLDWNHVDHNILGTCSVDTTCTIWNVDTGQAKTQLIAHDKQVFDIAFSTSPDIFASVGGDGSVRLFDLRNLEHSTILYETSDHTPLLRVAWNKLDHHFLLTFGATTNKITLLDTRYSSVPVAELLGHQSIINDIVWSPHSAAHACSVGDDRQVFIWNLLEASKGSDSVSNTSSTGSVASHANSSLLNPSLMFKLDTEGNQVIWPSSHPEWITVGEAESIRWIHI